MRNNKTGKEGEGTLFEFSVADTGVGITKEATGHLFQPFMQVGSIKSEMGLALCGPCTETYFPTNYPLCTHKNERRKSGCTNAQFNGILAGKKVKSDSNTTLAFSHLKETYRCISFLRLPNVQADASVSEIRRHRVGSRHLQEASESNGRGHWGRERGRGGVYVYFHGKTWSWVPKFGAYRGSRVDLAMQ